MKINTWEELSKCTSETHILDIDVEGCNGWVRPKIPNPNDMWEGLHYLSTHTFYGGTYEYSTEVLQSCGFDVEIANWDVDFESKLNKFRIKPKRIMKFKLTPKSEVE
jgi:hypothetical protein